MELTFPRHVHQRGGVYRICEDADTYETAKAEGWVDHPPLGWPVPDVYREWDPAAPVALPVGVDAPVPPKGGRRSKATASAAPAAGSTA